MCPFGSIYLFEIGDEYFRNITGMVYLFLSWGLGGGVGLFLYFYINDWKWVLRIIGLLFFIIGTGFLYIEETTLYLL